MKAILCSNQAEFDSIDAKIVAYWNANLCPPNGTTDKWSDPKVNPITNEIWIVVEDKILGALSDSEKSRIVNGNTDASVWFEALGFNTGLGFRMACRGGDMIAFNNKWTKETNNGTAGATIVGIADMNGVPKMLAWSDLKSVFVNYSNYCEAIWIWKLQNQGA